MHSSMWLRFLVAVAAGAGFACRLGTEHLLGPEHKMRELSSIESGPTRFKLYSFEGSVDITGVSKYPIVGWGAESWKVRTWSREVADGELRAILAFLADEREKYPTGGRFGRVLERMDQIKAALSRQPMDSTMIAYMFDGGDPRLDGYQYGDWLYFYYLDARSHTIVEINNAVR